MSIGPSSPWRGCAANFPQPVPEKDELEAKFLVGTVHYFNCFILQPTLPASAYRSSRGEKDILNRVFRWDFTPYQEVFQDGFKCRRKADTPDDIYFSLKDYVGRRHRHDNSRCFTTHAFVSTTMDPDWHPTPFIINRKPSEIYRYEIYAPGGISIAATLGQNYQYHEDEVCFVAGIAPQYIRSAQHFKCPSHDGSITWERVDKELAINENFNPQSHLYRALPIQNPVVDYRMEDGSRVNLNIKYHRATERKQRSNDDAADWYAVGIAEVESCNINAAFRSFMINEAFLFMKNEYVRIDYGPGSTGDKVLMGPSLICHGFPILSGTVFGEYGIDCAFGSWTGTGHAFIFSGNLCALINYTPGTRHDKILIGPMTITAMFPFLKGTVFENGIDAAFESTTESEAYLFKGDQNARINYRFPGSITVRSIKEGFPCLRYTRFEYGVDAAFASHRHNEAYIFRGDSYALINFAPGTNDDYIIGGRVKEIKPNWPSLENIFPRKNHGLDIHAHSQPDQSDTESSSSSSSSDDEQDLGFSVLVDVKGLTKTKHMAYRFLFGPNL